MTRYACSNPSCPRRSPIAAEVAPTCYTCAQPMTEAPYYSTEQPRLRTNYVALVDNPPNSECRWNIPEPTPEQRASRTLPGLAIVVTPEPIGDLEALRTELEAEILRALTTIYRAPYDQPIPELTP